MSSARSKCPTCGGPTVMLSGGEHVHANERKHTEGLVDAERLTSAIEEYSLWEPGRAGHAAAHRKLMEAIR